MKVYTSLHNVKMNGMKMVIFLLFEVAKAEIEAKHHSEMKIFFVPIINVPSGFQSLKQIIKRWKERT